MELYRIFHYANGHYIRFEGVLKIIDDNSGKLLLHLISGEVSLVVPGWIATTFKPAPPPPSGNELQSILNTLQGKAGEGVGTI